MHNLPRFHVVFSWGSKTSSICKSPRHITLVHPGRHLGLSTVEAFRDVAFTSDCVAFPEESHFPRHPWGMAAEASQDSPWKFGPQKTTTEIINPKILAEISHPDKGYLPIHENPYKFKHSCIHGKYRIHGMGIFTCMFMVNGGEVNDQHVHDFILILMMDEKNRASLSWRVARHARWCVQANPP